MPHAAAPGGAWGRRVGCPPPPPPGHGWPGMKLSGPAMDGRPRWATTARNAAGRPPHAAIAASMRGASPHHAASGGRCRTRGHGWPGAARSATIRARGCLSPGQVSPRSEVRLREPRRGRVPHDLRIRSPHTPPGEIARYMDAPRTARAARSRNPAPALQTAARRARPVHLRRASRPPGLLASYTTVPWLSLGCRQYWP